MRKIDTEAYNKRLHTEIMELDKMIKSINPENVNQIDAGLIETADTYIKLISDTTWADNSNFNGIEMHKVKDLLFSLKLRKPIYFIKRELININDDTSPTTASGVVEIQVPDLFDGRNSFLSCRIHAYDSDGYRVYPIVSTSNQFTFSKVEARKNKTSISIEHLIELGFSYDWIRLDVFSVFWR